MNAERINKVMTKLSELNSKYGVQGSSEIKRDCMMMFLDELDKALATIYKKKSTKKKRA